jgi:oligopeptide/dipeptide ABC transporter ATP-binding protein
MKSFPPLSGPRAIMRGIPGSPPNLARPPSGCRFHPRCPYHDPSKEALFARQVEVKPRLTELAPGHWVACHLYDADLQEQGIRGLATTVQADNPDLEAVEKEVLPSTTPG